MTTTQKLERLYNRATRYEVVAEHPDGRRYLIGYTSPTRPGMLRMIRQNGQAVVDRLGLTQAAVMTWGGKGRLGHFATIGDWKVRFTGRTQRDAIIGGEVEFVK